jgi:hypothetical protein
VRILAVLTEMPVMTKTTCAACECNLDDNPIKVKIRGRTVEVCCVDCARKLKEADAAVQPGASPRA